MLFLLAEHPSLSWLPPAPLPNPLGWGSGYQPPDQPSLALLACLCKVWSASVTCAGL